jgi:hypothetical protein
MGNVQNCDNYTYVQFVPEIHRCSLTGKKNQTATGMRMNIVNSLAPRFRYKLRNPKFLPPNSPLKTVDTDCGKSPYLL